MNKYLLTIRHMSDSGAVVDSNCWLTTDGPLTQDVIKRAAEEDRKEAQKGIYTPLTKFLVNFVYKLEA